MREKQAFISEISEISENLREKISKKNILAQGGMAKSFTRRTTEFK
jgi:hypothetical protein